MGKKGQRVEDPDEAKARAQRELEQSEQKALMEGSPAKRVNPLEPDAYEFFNAAEADGLAPKNFIQLSALRKEAERRGRSLSLEELRLYYGRDETSPAAEPECAVCGRRFIARVWAIGSTDGIVRDNHDPGGKPLLAGAYVVRYSSDEGKPRPLPGCGSPFNSKSCITYLRSTVAVVEGGQLVFGKKALPAMPYERALKRAEELVRRQEENNQRLLRLGGLINRPRPLFRPSTPRGQRRSGGNTPHNRGDWR